MPKKGQALVEFIIILPIVLLMFLGIIDLGRIMYTKIILEWKRKKWGRNKRTTRFK